MESFEKGIDLKFQFHFMPGHLNVIRLDRNLFTCLPGDFILQNSYQTLSQKDQMTDTCRHGRR